MQEEESPDFLTITKDPYECYHLSIARQVQEQQLCQFVQKFVDTQKHANLSRQPSQISKAVWIKLRPPHLGFVARLYAMGFKIHSGGEDTITLCQWIAARKNLIPPYSVFYVGCGAAVILNGRILVVQESNGIRKGRFGLPSGRADPGETISLCAERELLEQTNLRGTFRGILYFREMSQSIYDCVDVYFVCLIQVDEKELQNLKLCQVEISGHRWLELSQYQEFMKSNGSMTQQMVAQYISRLHRAGFDFSSAALPRSVFEVQDMGQGRPKKLSAYHQLVQQSQSESKQV